MPTWRARPRLRALLQSIAGTLSLRVQQLDVTCETKSKDNVFIKLVISVQFQVGCVHLGALWPRLGRVLVVSVQCRGARAHVLYAFKCCGRADTVATCWSGAR
eukprot:350013-Chlamydomonas_euryale.AAC.2